MNTRIPRLLILALLAILNALIGFANADLIAGNDSKRRLIVLADMGNEPDEEQQMLHLLICSNEIEIEGLLAVTGKHLRPEDGRPYRRYLHPELFRRLVDHYEEVYPNLLKHAKGWNEPNHLRRVIASGQPDYGIAAIGEGKSTEGSQLIIDAVTKRDSRPLYIVVNAGSNTLAQALYDYRASHSAEEVETFVSKMRVFENAAQDDGGAWINHNFPSIHWIRSLHQTKGYGGPGNEHLGPVVWQPYEKSPDGQDQWADKHMRTGHGPFGEIYPARRIRRFHFIEGGGTIPWMRLVSRGLTDLSDPSSGGWSGRYSNEKLLNVHTRYADIAELEKASTPFFVYSETKGFDDRWTDPIEGTEYHETSVAVWRWRQAMWNDFRARMDWCAEPYENANHHPVAALNGDTSNLIMKFSAKLGQTMTFDAAASRDPDEDALRYSWWVYSEASPRPYGKPVPIEKATEPEIEFRIPDDAGGKELHLILEVWDQSSVVPLVDYRRAVISVENTSVDSIF